MASRPPKGYLAYLALTVMLLCAAWFTGSWGQGASRNPVTFSDPYGQAPVANRLPRMMEGTAYVTNSGLSDDGSRLAYGPGPIEAQANTPDPWGGKSPAFMMGQGDVGIYWGKGPPSVIAPRGSLYLRTDAGNATSRMYVSTGFGGWAATWTTR